jgi:iron-sulfur cluster assembly protein
MSILIIMITITERASTHLASVSDGQTRVEFSVDGGGCSGLNYTLQFTDRSETDRDQIIYFADGQMKLLVPFGSYVYLSGTEIDWSDDLLNGGFKFTNPQANRTCGCGTSFSV